MPAFTLNGIPISDEQCIGDSLPIINNAFLSLSSNLTLSDRDLANLTSLVGVLSTVNVTVVATSSFQLRPVHHRSLILCNNPNEMIITVPTTGFTFEIGHQTTFIQVNAGKVVFSSGLSGFNCLNSNNAIIGRNGVVTTRFTGSRGWFADGDLKSATEPPQLLSLVAGVGNGGNEDIDNEIGFTGVIEDTMYYYPTPSLTAVEPPQMDVYVNGFYRTTVDFPGDMLGTPFGYSVAGYSGTGPQTTTVFKEGRLDLFLEGGMPVFRNLTAQPSPGSEDVFASISITGNKRDTIFYYTSPAKSAISTYMDIYVNGFYRTTVDFQEDRLGSQFGYKLEEHFGNASQVTGTFVDEDAVYFNIPGALVPPVIQMVASTTPGTSNEDLNMSITATDPTYTDTFAAFPWPGQSAQTYTADIFVDGVHRTTIDFTKDRVGDKFWYRKAGVGGTTYQAEGTFPEVPQGTVGVINITIQGAPALPTPTPSPTVRPTATPRPTPLPSPTPTSTPPVTQTLFFLTAKPAAQGGTDDDLNSISIRSTIGSSDYNDTISYRALTLQNVIMAEPMEVYINGVHRTTVDFPEGRSNTVFNYKRAGQNETLTGVFASGRVDVVALGSDIFNLVAKPATLGGTDDPANAISIRSTVTNSSYNDTITYRSLTLASYVMAEPMDIYIGGVHRTTVDFPEGRLNTPFTYTRAGDTVVISGTFSSGRRDLPVPPPAPTPLPTSTPAPTQSLGSWTWSVGALTDNGEGNFTGSGTVDYPLNLTPPSAGQPDNGLSITSGFLGDTFYGNNLLASGGEVAPRMLIINLNGTARALIEFDSARVGTQFGFKPAGSSTIYTGTYPSDNPGTINFNT